MKLILYSLYFISQLSADPMKNYSTKATQFFQELNNESMHLVEDFYADNIVFLDPVGKVEGRKNLKAYYKIMYENVTEIHFDFNKTHQLNQSVYLHWIMTFKSKKLKRGQKISVPGISYLEFDSFDKVVYHKDSFDMGAMVYENIPLMGWFVRKIKQRFEHQTP
jgi:ketosteroid isomerase-like protein